jgi:hypothetical protein
MILQVGPTRGKELTPTLLRVGRVQHKESTNRVTGFSRIAGPMIDEQVPVIWEIDVFMGRQTAPQGYVNFRYADGRDYSGYMMHGRPSGYGVMRGPVISYIGIWEDGVLVEGIMADAVRASEFRIPFQTETPEHPRAPDPQ